MEQGLVAACCWPKPIAQESLPGRTSCEQAAAAVTTAVIWEEEQHIGILGMDLRRLHSTRTSDLWHPVAI